MEQASPRLTCVLMHITALFCFTLWRAFAVDNNDAGRPHVCIIGAGIGGASTAHFLARMRRPPHVTVFEQEAEVGGRVRSLYACGETPVEAGASIIASGNRLMRYFTRFLNLSEKSRSEGESLGLWDGERFVFRTAETRAETIARVISRYRLSAMRGRRFVRGLIDQYASLYPDDGVHTMWPAHLYVESLLLRTRGLYNMSQTGFAPMARAMFSRHYVAEMLSAIVRVNYGQDIDNINALAGSIAFAGAGNDLWAVSGGNHRVISGLFEQSLAHVRLKTRVRAVRRRDGGSYYVVIDNEDGENANTESMTACDAIVLAAPIELTNMSLPHDIADALDVGRSFHQTVSTFIRGQLRKATFGDDIPNAILTITNLDKDFTSIGKQCSGDDKNNDRGEYPLWKIFSRNLLTTETMEHLFEDGAKIIATFPWLAYPKFSLAERFAPFVADNVEKAFFYTSSLESAGSAMEMSAVAGANAAALVNARFDFGGIPDSPNDHKEKSDL